MAKPTEAAGGVHIKYLGESSDDEDQEQDSGSSESQNAVVEMVMPWISAPNLKLTCP